MSDNSSSEKPIHVHLSEAKTAEEYIRRLGETTSGGLIDKSAFDEALAGIKSHYGTNLQSLIDFYLILYDANYGWFEALDILDKFPNFSDDLRSYNIVNREHTQAQVGNLIEFTEGFQLQAQISWVKAKQVIKQLEDTEAATTELFNPKSEELEVSDLNTSRVEKFLLAGLITPSEPANINTLGTAFHKIEDFLKTNGLQHEDLDSLDKIMQRRHPISKNWDKQAATQQIGLKV